MDAIAPVVEGKFMSGVIRARKKPRVAEGKCCAASRCG